MVVPTWLMTSGMLSSPPLSVPGPPACLRECSHTCENCIKAGVKNTALDSNELNGGEFQGCVGVATLLLGSMA